jgi:phenylacetate-coenzyme A ligase PaaK-like adenylate-forming protein
MTGRTWPTASSTFRGEHAYFYGFSEQTGLSVRCEQGRLHLPPWSIPLILDPDTSELLPRDGVHVGRAAFFDLAMNGAWGGLITGDKVEIDWRPCSCGRTTPHLAEEITRFSVEQGGTDKITCTATPEAHDAALDFLTSF